jgi:uncharacterized protein (TIGR02444 family)
LATSENEEPASEAFWGFSLAFYAIPDVAEALITLQDRDGFDVNLMLFALWIGVSGRGRHDRDGLMAADRAVCEVRAEIVQPLRTLRRRLAQCPETDVQELRRAVKALELAAEKIVQTRLARLAGPVCAKTGDVAAAHANLAAYLGPSSAASAEAAIIRGAINQFASRPSA